MDGREIRAKPKACAGAMQKSAVLPGLRCQARLNAHSAGARERTFKPGPRIALHQKDLKLAP
jgi:hypothetical protein